MNPNDKKSFKASDINDFLGLSSDSGSDWDDIKEIPVSEFLTEKKDKNEPEKKVFQKKNDNKKSKIIMPFDIVPETIPKEKQKVPEIEKVSKYFIAIPTRIRVLNPQVSMENWKERTENREVVPISKGCQNKVVDSLTDADWILIGVIVQVVVKKDKSNKNFCIWHLNDLQCLDKSVKMMLFRDTYDKFWKEDVGTVIAVLKPKCLPTDEKFKVKTFVVDNAMQIMVLGRSPDYGICQGKTKSGEKCKNLVNKGDCSLCSYHVQSGYFEAMSRPGFGNCGIEKLNERKRKAPNSSYIKDNKIPKVDGGIYINNRINSNLSLETLQKSGITARATNWGLLDKSIQVPVNVASTNPDSDKTTPLVNMLKRPSSGSMNLVKHIVEKSTGSRPVIKPVVSNGNQGVTFEALRKKMQPDLPKQSINLGYIPAKLDGANAEVYRAELNKLRLAAQAKEKGGYAALRESNKQDHIKKVCTSAENESLSKKPILNEEMLKLLSQGSSNRKLVEMDKMADLDRKLDRVEAVEKLETKLTTQHEQECILFVCVQCKSKTAMKPRFCVAEKHTIKSIKGFRRYFQCIKCKERTTTYDKYPEGSCLKCGACAYEKTGKMKEREIVTEKLKIRGDEKTGKMKEREIVTEKLKIRGDEKKFINN